MKLAKALRVMPSVPLASPVAFPTFGLTRFPPGYSRSELPAVESVGLNDN